MPHNSRLRANLAAWALNSAVTPAEFDAIDQMLFESLNGDRGGVWLPSAKIYIGGQGLEVTTAFRSMGASGYNASLQAQNWPERSILATATTPVNSDTPIAYAPPGTLGYGAGGMLATLTVNRSALARSDEGTVWAAGGSFAGDFSASPGNDIAYGMVVGAPGFLISAANNGSLARSADMATYTYVGSVIGTRAVLCYAAAPFDIWVAAGDAGTIHTSSDQGATWTARTTPAGWQAGCGGAKRIVWNGSLFVVLPRGIYDKVLTSSNGITWTERALNGSTQTWTGLAYSPYDLLWMAVADSGEISTSTSGITWSGVATVAHATDLAVINSLWVAPLRNGEYSGIAWSTDKGANWQRTPVGNHRVATGGWKRVIVADNRFVLAHADGANLEFALSLRSS